MGDLLTTGGVLAAFFAGGVALFAPCCIVFLAPSYLAGAVKNRRWRLLPLTFLFAAGLASILVPITVGISLIAAAIAKYHTVLYWAGGILMLVLAPLVVIDHPVERIVGRRAIVPVVLDPLHAVDAQVPPFVAVREPAPNVDVGVDPAARIVERAAGLDQQLLAVVGHDRHLGVGVVVHPADDTLELQLAALSSS